MATDRLIAIVVLVATIGVSAFVAKTFQLPELYAVTGILTYFLGTLTGKPTPRRIERTLQKMAPLERDSLIERVTGRPRAMPRQQIRIEGGDDDA